MRTLPLGVLIVCGGTFAALPFRRYQPTFPPVSDPFQATGPSESTLFPLDFETSNLRADVVQLERSVVDSRLVSEVDSSSASGISELRSMPRQISRRASDIPLTFEDLAAPIEHPGTARDRWVQAGTSDSSADTGAAGDALVGVPQGHPRTERGPGSSNRTRSDLAENRGSKSRTSTRAKQPPAQQEGPMQLADNRNGEQRGKWTAEQIFTHSEVQKVGGARGRFASSASDGANQRLGSEKEAGDSAYRSGWRALPDADQSNRHPNWIHQP